MQQELKKFQTHDRLQLYYRSLLSDRDSACVVYLHGLESHMGWFSAMASFLNQHGLNVYAFDRRGSGLNQSQRGHLYSYYYLFDDIKVFLDLVKKEHPKSKLFLMGLCLGGKIAANFFLFYPYCVDGLILISPSIENRLKLSWFTKMEILVAAFLFQRKMFKIPIDDAMFTANKKYLEFIRYDPLRLRYISARYFLEIARMDFDLKKVSHRVNVPLLLMLAGIDEIIDVGAASRWFNLVHSSDKTIKIYKDYYHMLLYEENAPEVMQYIVDWVKKHS